MSIVQKLRLVLRPKRRPTKTNMSIREMPVMISGFIIGMFVTVSKAVFRYLRRSRWMPTAAAVPMAVEMIEAVTASTSVFCSARSVSSSLNSSRYHLTEKSENTLRLFVALKLNTSRIAIGAKRNRKMSAV